MNKKVEYFLKQILTRFGFKKFIKFLIIYINPKYYFHTDKVIDIFIDSKGNEHKVYKGFRLSIYPKAEKKFNDSEKNKNKLLTEKKIISSFEQNRNKINIMKDTLKKNGFSLKDKDVLEVGCSIGLNLYELIKIGCNSAIGSDLGKYYVVQDSENKFGIKAIEIANHNLNITRKNVQNILIANKIINDNLIKLNKISFVEDDICNSNLDDNKFDIICSFQVMEHVCDPQKAFCEIYRLLKTGGISYHRYNSFSNFAGGHSYCTLDIPWGHCQLNPDDFDKYLKKYRPDESKISKKFYYESLNRISIKQTVDIVTKAGFKIQNMNLHPKYWPKKYLNNKILSNIQEIYPDVQKDDLLSTIELVLIK